MSSLRERILGMPRKLWRPGDQTVDDLFTVVVPVQFGSWEVRRRVTASLKGESPGPLQHPDIGTALELMKPEELGPVVYNAQATLRVFDHLSVDQLRLGRTLGVRLLQFEDSPGVTRLTAAELIPSASGIGVTEAEADLAQFLAELGHIFWLEGRVLRRAFKQERAKEGGKTHWAHHVFEDLPEAAVQETLIQGFCHGRTLGAVSDETFEALCRLHS